MATMLSARYLALDIMGAIGFSQGESMIQKYLNMGVTISYYSSFFISFSVISDRFVGGPGG